MTSRFDEVIDRRGTHSAKWDLMEPIYGVSPDDGLAMWVADMEFRPPEAVQAAVQAMADHGVYGYYGDDTAYLDAIRWWMSNRHGWDIERHWIMTTHGLVNGIGLALQAYSKPGDGIVLFTPVYHAFHRVIKSAGRTVVECPLVEKDGRYEMDFGAYDALMTGSESVVILCSPHNPGGRVWSPDELRGVAEFAKRHDLVLISDEIHHDIVLPGYKHTPMALIEGITDRLVMMSATTKTFNIAGAHTGNVIIEDEALRTKFVDVMAGLGMSPNSFGLNMATAAYSPEGAAWVDEMTAYIDGNRKMFEAAINGIPGLSCMTLEATYLAWVDYSGTGMDEAEILRRIEGEAKIAPNYGPAFGRGGESCMRFNIAMPRASIVEACERLTAAFADLQ
ncbi:aminotransferase [Salipiger pallidus]|uniref:cysteine-S-conjugate beta-lyase n=1 Tax=Salipiger pallidus TaxID=1775170 RepID=A0A8J2ZJZ0_9RHOB|nr:MalY/PatB family protein [Salipiger pallidus]GGG71980.1 aminotransferase [Salipiger pallidus]